MCWPPTDSDETKDFPSDVSNETKDFPSGVSNETKDQKGVPLFQKPRLLGLVGEKEGCDFAND